MCVFIRNCIWLAFTFNTFCIHNLQVKLGIMKKSNNKSNSDPSGKLVSQAKPQRPIYWKQVLITTFTVYPLLMLIQWLLSSFSPMQSVPKELAVLIAVLAVASLMVFPVMPLTMKLLGSWLYKK